ncbi:hypothetical protein BLOT_003539 [Blomia tropicalis]|nr:hypothetical protein BLOT_003539 [Blomia tropicalis]
MESGYVFESCDSEQNITNVFVLSFMLGRLNEIKRRTSSAFGQQISVTNATSAPMRQDTNK